LRLGQPLGLVGDGLQRRRQLAGLRRLKFFVVGGRQADPSLAGAIVELAADDADRRVPDTPCAAVEFAPRSPVWSCQP